MTILSDAEIRILLEALDDEYRAHATYGQVIEDFGPVRPFVNIREAEGRHIEALLALFERYDVPVPDNPWPGRVDRYATPEEACRAGVEAEIANGAMYDRLLRKAHRPDIIPVLASLRAASRERHLPAFQRCAERGPGGREQQRGGRCGGGEQWRRRKGV
jgi:hypothetical protein